MSPRAEGKAVTWQCNQRPRKGPPPSYLNKVEAWGALSHNFRYFHLPKRCWGMHCMRYGQSSLQAEGTVDIEHRQYDQLARVRPGSSLITGWGHLGVQCVHTHTTPTYACLLGILPASHHVAAVGELHTLPSLHRAHLCSLFQAHDLNRRLTSSSPGSRTACCTPAAAG